MEKSIKIIPEQEQGLNPSVLSLNKNKNNLITRVTDPFKNIPTREIVIYDNICQEIVCKNWSQCTAWVNVCVQTALNTSCV